MIRAIVGSALKFRGLILGIAAAVIGIGVVTLRDAPVDVYPEFTPPYVEIQTESLGLSAAEVEQLITVPLEADLLNGVEGVEVIRSSSLPGLSSIVLVFEPGTDVYRGRQLVQERLAGITAQLPTWASPPFMMPPLSSTSRILKIGLTSDELSLIDMSAIAYWKIRSRLLRVPGVAQVMIYGERLHQRHIQVDPELLAEHGVSLSTVMEETANAMDAGVLQFSEAFTVGTGGFIESNGQRLNVRHVLPILTADDLAKVPIERRNGELVRLSDVGLVVEDHMPLWGDASSTSVPG